MAIVPQRVSLLAQTVDSLRVGIAREQWKDFLPPERILCEQLKISRSTLRRALSKIEEEGLIDLGQAGKRRQIVAKPKISATTPVFKEPRNIVWLTRVPLIEMPSINLRLIAQLQSRLSGHDCTLSVVRVPEKVIAQPEELMESWLSSFAGDAWVLHQMPVEVQQWFFEYHPTACIVGTRGEAVDLGSVEVDSSAALQHAVAMLGRFGHRRVTLVRNAQHMVGEDLLEDVFLRLCKENGMSADVVACPMRSHELASEFERRFSSGESQLPTALICSIPSLALFALTWLQRHQIRVPEQMSVVLLRSQPILRYTSPTLAHYAINEERAVTQILPRLLDLIQSQACATSHINLIPEFVPGESLAVAQD